MDFCVLNAKGDTTKLVRPKFQMPHWENVVIKFLKAIHSALSPPLWNVEPFQCVNTSLEQNYNEHYTNIFTCRTVLACDSEIMYQGPEGATRLV